MSALSRHKQRSQTFVRMRVTNDLLFILVAFLVALIFLTGFTVYIVVYPPGFLVDLLQVFYYVYNVHDVVLL